MRIVSRRYAAAALFIVITTTLQAQPAFNGSLPEAKLNGSNSPAESAKKALKDPLRGVIVNRTVTVFGHDFYRYFSSIWREKEDMSDFSISIHERPTARFGSEIWVEYRQRRMFHAFLSPARSAIKKISEVASEIVYQNISRSEVERALKHSPDLGPEEL